MTPRVRDLLLAVLAVTTGVTDAAAFLRLGNVFASVITGNLALLGVAAGQGSGDLAVNGGVALAGYGLGVLVAGAFVGSREENQPTWPRRVTVSLAAEFAVLAGFSAGWLAQAGHPAAGAGRLGLLIAAAAAMGMQATAVRRFGQVSTTYLTSTLTSLVEAIAHRRMPDGWQRSTAILVCFVAGAAFGALAIAQSPSWVPVAMLLPLAAVLGAASLARS